MTSRTLLPPRVNEQMLNEALERAEKQRERTEHVQEQLAQAADATMQQLGLGFNEPQDTIPSPMLGSPLFVQHRITNEVAQYNADGESLVVNFLRMLAEASGSQDMMYEEFQMMLHYERKLGLLPDDRGVSVDVELSNGVRHSIVQMLTERYDSLSYLDVMRMNDLIEVTCIILFWFGTHTQLGLTVERLATTASAVETRGVSHPHMILQKVVIEFFVIAFDRAVQSYTMLDDMPWDWQEMLWLSAFRTILDDVEGLQQLYDDEILFQEAYGGGS